MKCMHCVAHVEEALKSVAGVSNVEVSLENGSATVEWDGAQATAEDLKTAVDGAGRYELSL